MANDLELGGVEVGDGLAAVAIGDTLISLWRDPASMERWMWLMERKRELAARCAGGILVLSVILPSSKPPDAKIRAAMRDSLGSLGSHLRQIVVLPVWDGVWHAVVRTIVRGILLLSGQGQQQTVASSLQEAVARLRELSSPATPDAATLRAAVDTLATALGVPTVKVA
jgi:hypothetical protein